MIELETRIAAAGVELEQTRTQLSGIAEERTQQHSFLETAAGEAKAFRQQVEARQIEARTAAEGVPPDLTSVTGRFRYAAGKVLCGVELPCDPTRELDR